LKEDFLFGRGGFFIAAVSRERLPVALPFPASTGSMSVSSEVSDWRQQKQLPVISNMFIN